MVVFSYNENTNTIEAKVSPDDWRSVHLKGGVWLPRQKEYWFPMNYENIGILFASYNEKIKNLANRQDYIWKPSLHEGMLKFLKDYISEQSALNFLHSLKIENVSKYPLLECKDKEIPPFKNQHIAQFWAQYMPHHGRLWDMGTGKTRSSIEAYVIKKRASKVNHGLVVCPLSMQIKWVREIDQWSGGMAYPVIGNKEEKNTILKEGWEWLVVTYETLAVMVDDFLEIVDDKWFIVLDETTKIKNPHAKRAKACHALGLKTKHKEILTGTPVTQGAYDVFSQYRFLDCGETFGYKYEDFLDKYFFRSGWKLKEKYGAIEEISELMYKSATRFLKKDCIDIPDKVYDTRILTLPPLNQQKYDEMVMWAITQLEQSERVTAPVILTQLLRLSQITGGFVKDVEGKEVAFEDNPKLNALSDILETMDCKAVVWCRFQFEVKMIKELCDKMKIQAVTLYGEDNSKQRTINIDKFQGDPDTRVIIGTAGTGGHGIDLVAAQLVVYYSNSYSLEQRLQSEDRAHRAGQRNQVTYIDLLCEKTIDVAIYKILRNKKNVADMVTKDNLRSFI